MRLYLAGALIALSAGCAGAAGDAGAADGNTDKVTAETTAGEQLLAQPPAGWRRIGAANSERLKRAQFIPENDDETLWNRRITFEAMVEQPLPDPIEFVQLITAGRDQDCGTFEAHPTFAGEENGYPTTVYLLVCHKDADTGRSEVTMMKSIQGNDAFYVITRSYRGKPIEAGAPPPVTEEEIGGWALYLKSVSLCDATRPEHGCPGASG